jgi:DNA polymerase-3 subunit epsilon
MREIVVDTETTGLDPADGHRIIEVGCVELVDHVPTGLTLQRYLNPEREVPVEALRIHGINDQFLSSMPLFSAIADELLEFFGDAALVMHNAGFDLKFINAELLRVARPLIPSARTIDTIEIAKARIPGARYSLDELCRRFGIDLACRTKHGALLDAQLTARVYLELVGGRQTRLRLAPRDTVRVISEIRVAVLQRPEQLPARLSSAELDAHTAFVAAELGGDAVWAWQ